MYRRQFALIKSSLSLRILIVLTLLLTLGLPGAAEPLQAAGEPVSPFSDLAPSDENYRYVKFLQNKGVINGFPDGTFQPYGSLTRAEAAKMLVTAAGLPLQSTGHPTYSDVSPDHWAYPYIETATHLGLLTGYPDGTFQPQRQLTRAETAVILYRIYGTDYQWSGDPLAVDLPAWAAGPASSIIDAGLMGIDEEKRFQPDWATPRVEFARALALLHTLHDNWRIVPLKATLWPKSGVVQLQKPGQQPVSVTQPAVLAVDDVVITGSRGEAEIRFEDGSALLLTANSELKVQALVGSLFILPDGTEGSAVEDLQVQFLKGSMFGALATRGVDPETLLPQTAAAGNWSMFPLLALAGDNWEAVGYSANATLAANGNIDDVDIDPDSEAFKKLPPWKQLQLKKVKVKVNMPHGVAAVRGSFWKIQLEQIGERIREIINFIHGEGEVQSGDHTVPIRAGEKTAIEEPGAPPTPPEPMTREEQQEWVAMKDWVTERIQEIQEKLTAPPVAPPPVPAGQQPEQVQQREQQPPVPVLTQILEFLQELLSTMEALEEKVGLPPAPPQPVEDDDDDYYDDDDSGSDWSAPGDDDQPEVPSTYKIDYTIPPDINKNVEVTIAVTIATLAQGDFGYNKVQLEFGVAGPQGAKATFKAKDPDGTEHTYINEGIWGPPEGFALPADYAGTTQWQVAFDQPGNYTITFSLINLDNGEIIAQRSEAIIVGESGLIKSGRIEPARPNDYEINIQFFGPAIFNGHDEELGQVYLSLGGEDYCLSIVGLSEEEDPEVPLLDFNTGFYMEDGEKFSQLKLSYDGVLDPHRHYYAKLWQEEKPEQAYTYDLTPLGIETVEVNINPYYDMEFLRALLTSDDSSAVPRQIQPVYLMPNDTQGTFQAVVPKWPGMANGSWHLTGISDYSPHFGDGYKPSYYNPALSVFEESRSDNVDFDPVTIEKILDIQVYGNTIITIIEAKDKNGIEELMTIYQSPSGHLVPSIARKEVEYEERQAWEIITDIGFGEWPGEEGEWSLVGLITKDGANNWVVPSIAGLEHYLLSCYAYYWDNSGYIWDFYTGYWCEIESEVPELPYDALVDGINAAFHESFYRPKLDQKVLVDFTPPQIIGSAINSSFLVPGDTFQIELHAVDNCSGIEELEVRVHESPVGEEKMIHESWNDSAEKQIISFDIPTEWGAGTYWVDVLLRDAAGNEKSKPNIQWFTIVDNAEIAIEETTPWYNAGEVSINTPITLTFNMPVEPVYGTTGPYDGFEDIELRGVSFADGSINVADFVYFDESRKTMEVRLDGITLAPGTSYDLFIPQQALVSVDGSGTLPADIFLIFRTKGEEAPLEFPENREEWVDNWMLAEWWKSAQSVISILGLDNTYSDNWFWLQFGNKQKILVKGEDDVVMGLGPMRIWEYGSDETTAFELTTRALYLPHGSILFDPAEDFTFNIKGVYLPDENQTEDITVELSWSEEPLGIQRNNDTLQITIPGLDDPGPDYHQVTVRYCANGQCHEFYMQIIIIQNYDDPPFGKIRWWLPV